MLGELLPDSFDPEAADHPRLGDPPTASQSGQGNRQSEDAQGPSASEPTTGPVCLAGKGSCGAGGLPVLGPPPIQVSDE